MAKTKRSKPLNNRMLKRIYIAIIYIIMIPGVYFFGMRSTESEKIALAATIITAAGLIFLLILGAVAAKKGRQKKYIKFVLLISVIVLVVANLPSLVSSYFIPSRTTTIHNRYYPESLEHGYRLEHYVNEKTLLIDPSNGYFERSEADYTAIDHINIVSIMSSVKSLETLDEPFGRLNTAQLDYLLAYPEDYWTMVNYFNHEEVMYFYQGLESDTYDTVVYLQDADSNLYLMPYSVFLTLKEIG